jgi:adenylosuccinate lyase
MESYTHETFLSPFTWRYGSEPMRRLWSQTHKRQLWRQLWVALAEAQERIGLVTAEQVADLRAHQNDIDITRAHELEAELQHDLMAEVHTFAEQCSIGGGIIHLGATSMDIEDNAEALCLRDALDVLIPKMAALLTQMAEKIEATADLVCMAFTHLQPAEPTTVGYRLAFTAQDLLEDYQALQRVRASLRGKGFKGAVGTSASYTELLRGKGITPRQLEEQILGVFGLNAFEITHQTYPRRQDYDILSVLAGFGATAYKFAFDLRILQSPVIGEWHEPFGSRQIGSSAMPFKRNPIHSENIDSMARYLAGLPRVAWDNAAHHLLERTLDDSANRRVVLPEAFLTADEILTRLTRLVSGLRIDENSITRTLNTYGVFAATERLLMEAARRGGNRQELHEVIRQQSLAAWEALRQNQPNPLISLLQADPHFTALIPAEEIPALLTAEAHIGDAPERARRLAASIHETLSSDT